MADATTTFFPAGTSVSIYPAAQCEPYKEQARVPAPLTATDTQTSDTNCLTSFTGVTAGLYYAVGTIGGVVRYVNIRATD